MSSIEDALGRSRVLPVVAVDDAEVVDDLCGALLEGGISCIEITFRTDAAVAAIERAARVEGMLVGAGTVLTAEQAHAAARAGARFAVAPGTDGEVVGACSAAGLPFFPGIATPSELGHAARLGCTTVKVFPAATLGGPAFLRAVSDNDAAAMWEKLSGETRGLLEGLYAARSAVALQHAAGVESSGEDARLAVEAAA